MPRTRWGKITEYFEKLDSLREKLPRWQGELYLEYHRGVLTTHGNLKEAFRKSERAMQIWEAARVLCGGGEVDVEVWKRVVFAQFHDYIPGSSIWEVYEEGLPELRRIADEALKSAVGELKEGSLPALLNPLPQPVRLAHPKGTGIVELPPLSGTPLAELQPIAAHSPVRVTKTRLSNDQVSVQFDRQGRIQKLSLQGREIPVRSRLNELVLYPDHAHMFEAWDIDRQTLCLGKKVSATAELQTGEGSLCFNLPLGKKSQACIHYEIDPAYPVLHIRYEIDWQEENRLLKAMFHTDYTGVNARFGAPFGSVLRSQIPGRERDEAMFESAASRWAVISDDAATSGLAVLTEAKYGFSCRDGSLGLSLIRSPKVTGEDPNHQSLFAGKNRAGASRPACSDLGKHIIQISLCLSEPGLPRELQASALAESLYTRPVSYRGEARRSGFRGLKGGDTLQAVWAKPARDGHGWILRLNETMGQRGSAEMDLEEGWTATPTDLLEKDLGAPLRKIDFTPYALLSFRIRKA